MRRTAGDKFDQARIVEVAEAFDDVPVQSEEVLQGLLEEMAPVLCGAREVLVATVPEIGFVFVGGLNLALQILRKFRLEYRVRQLLEQHRREINVGFEGQPVTLEISENPQQRQISLGCGFEQPFQTVGPGTVVHDPWQMRMQRERKIAVGPAILHAGVLESLF